MAIFFQHFETLCLFKPQKYNTIPLTYKEYKEKNQFIADNFTKVPFRNNLFN